MKQGNYIYRTTCLTCGWHKDCGSSFSQIQEHLSECLTGVVVLSVQINWDDCEDKTEIKVTPIIRTVSPHLLSDIQVVNGGPDNA